MRLAAEPFHDSRSNSRLADAGFTRDQHHLTVAPLGLLPPSQEQIDFLVAADQRRGRRAQRLEAALHHARAHHLVCLHPIRKALRLDGAEITVLKEIAQQTVGGCIDGDGAGCRRRLQTRRKVRRLADHTALLGFAGADQIADHHYTGSNSNADLERFNAAQLANRFD